MSATLVAAPQLPLQTLPAESPRWTQASTLPTRTLTQHTCDGGLRQSCCVRVRVNVPSCHRAARGSYPVHQPILSMLRRRSRRNRRQVKDIDYAGLHAGVAAGGRFASPTPTPSRRATPRSGPSGASALSGQSGGRSAARSTAAVRRAARPSPPDRTGETRLEGVCAVVVCSPPPRVHFHRRCSDV
jgi:hypothetical protein